MMNKRAAADFKKKYLQIVENIDDLIIIFDDEGNHEILNENAFSRMFGFKKEDNEFNFILGLIEPEVESRLELKGNILKVKNKKGNWVWLEINAKKFVDDNNHSKWLTITRDVSERKNETASIIRSGYSQLQDAFEKQKKIIDQLIKASQFKSEFMATMSHELRTPLNAIIGFADVLAEELYGKLSEEQQEFVQNVLSSSEYLLHLVDQFLDISKIESGKLTTNIHPVKLNELINELLIEIKPLYTSKELEINLQGLEDQKIVYADPVKLKEILLNLISNAIKYTTNGSIGIRFLEKESCYEISISDTGIGIAEKDFPKIFKEFERIDTPETVSKGTGLGLALTKRLVNLHSGEIFFTSELGKGSTFSFTLPKILKDIMENNISEALPVEATITDIINVLLIEDNNHDADIIQNLLQEIKTINFNVHLATNLTNGIDYLKTHNDINLILLDLLLPETEGLETAQAVLNLKLKIPLIILTVVDNIILASEIIRKGAQDFLVKNEINPNMLEKSIRFAFERCKNPGK